MTPPVAVFAEAPTRAPHAIHLSETPTCEEIGAEQAQCWAMLCKPWTSSAIRKAQSEHGVRFHRESFDFVGLSPEVLVAVATGLHARHFHFVASKLAALRPRLKLDAATGSSARHLDHEVHAGDHEAML